MYVAEYSDCLGPVVPQELRTANYELLYWSSRQCWRRGDRDAALALCLRAIDVSSSAPDHYHETLGNFALDLGCYSMARQNYELVIANAMKRGDVAAGETVRNHSKSVKMLSRGKE